MGRPFTSMGAYIPVTPWSATVPGRVLSTSSAWIWNGRGYLGQRRREPTAGAGRAAAKGKDKSRGFLNGVGVCQNEGEARPHWRFALIDTVLNLLFRCPHRRLTRPVTPVSKAGVPHGETYVVCLDCGKQFSYDLKEMRIRKPIDHSHDAGVLPPDMPKPRANPWKYVALAAVPLAAVLGAAVKGKKRSGAQPEAEKGAPGEHGDAGHSEK